LQDYVRVLDGQRRVDTGQRLAAGHGVTVWQRPDKLTVECD
jgi:hypothetical protein